MMGKIDCWGMDVFRLSDITMGRPLTAVAYTIFQVTFSFFTQRASVFYSHNVML